MCRTNISLPGNAIDQLDHLEITCNVKHSGRWTPVFSCAPGFRGYNDSEISSTEGVHYRRVIAASDIADYTVLHCKMIFDNAVIRRSDFPWNTSTIRVVNSTGKTIVNFCLQGFFLEPTFKNRFVG